MCPPVPRAQLLHTSHADASLQRQDKCVDVARGRAKGGHDHSWSGHGQSLRNRSGLLEFRLRINCDDREGIRWQSFGAARGDQLLSEDSLLCHTSFVVAEETQKEDEHQRREFHRPADALSAQGFEIEMHLIQTSHVLDSLASVEHLHLPSDDQRRNSQRSRQSKIDRLSSYAHTHRLSQGISDELVKESILIIAVFLNNQHYQSLPEK